VLAYAGSYFARMKQVAVGRQWTSIAKIAEVLVNLKYSFTPAAQESYELFRSYVG